MLTLKYEAKYTSSHFSHGLRNNLKYFNPKNFTWMPLPIQLANVLFSVKIESETQDW